MKNAPRRARLVLPGLRGRVCDGGDLVFANVGHHHVVFREGDPLALDPRLDDRAYFGRRNQLVVQCLADAVDNVLDALADGGHVGGGCEVKRNGTLERCRGFHFFRLHQGTPK